MGRMWQNHFLVTEQTLQAYKYLHNFIFLYLARVIKMQTAESTDGNVVTDLYSSAILTPNVRL